MNSERPCVFFDRDGIVNRRAPDTYYVQRWEDFHLLPSFIEALRQVRRKGYPAAVVTNQRGVAIGRMTRETLDAMHARLLQTLAKEGLTLLNIYVCPHDKNTCDCRKPLPGMLLRAAREHRLDLARSWMIGDSESDIEAGRAAGCCTVLVRSGCELTAADYRLQAMEELPVFLEKHLPGPVSPSGGGGPSVGLGARARGNNGDGRAKEVRVGNP